ncbi:hypothetical protein [Streptomyces celluloflavus]|uniref:hypothetical protein n=1 Tax=Streptomyces celluloflavus TaxID=58344 RepID=UPI0036777154
MRRGAAWDLVGPRWARLTAVEGKDEVFAGDLFAREGWATLAGELGEEAAYAFAERVALMWIRPDAFASGAARRLVEAAGGAGFRVLAARPVRVDRCAVRALGAYMCRWATVERLWLLDALAALGPGLLVLWADEGDTQAGLSAPVRMTEVRGVNAPDRRIAGCLREVAGSPNRVLTMVHSADEPADVVRELGILCSPGERRALVAEAAHRLADREPGRWEDALRVVEEALPAMPVPQLPGDTRAAGPVREPDGLLRGSVTKRWSAVWEASHRWPLLAPESGPVSWPEQASRSPWR